MPASVVAINWDELVRDYAASLEMTVDNTLTFLSHRDSLETAVSLIGGLSADGGRRFSDIKPALKAFGKYLHAHGCDVPPTFCRADDYIRGAKEREGSAEEKPDPNMDLYLQYRIQGMSRTEASRQFNVSYPTFRRRLIEWGIYDTNAEVTEMAKFMTGDSGADIDSATPSKPMQPSHMEGGYKRSVTLNMTLTEAIIRESINALVDIAEFDDTRKQENIDDTVWKMFAYAREAKIDIASMLVRRLREASV